MTVTIFPKFITPQECEVLNLWTEKAYVNDWLGKGVGPKESPRHTIDTQLELILISLIDILI
jgi:hypothetical protein